MTGNNITNRFAPWAALAMSLTAVLLSYLLSDAGFRAHVEEREAAVMLRLERTEAMVETLRNGNTPILQSLAGLDRDVQYMGASILRIEAKLDELMK